MSGPGAIGGEMLEAGDAEFLRGKRELQARVEFGGVKADCEWLTDRPTVVHKSQTGSGPNRIP